MGLADHDLALDYIDNEIDYFSNTSNYPIAWEAFGALAVQVPLEQGWNSIKIAVADIGDQEVDSSIYVTNLEFQTGDGVPVIVNGTVDQNNLDASDANETFNLADGIGSVSGTLSELRDDVISGFDQLKSLVFESVTFLRSQLSVFSGSAILEVDINQDGSPDSKVTLEGDFNAGDFMTARLETDTQVTFESFLTALQNRKAVDGSEINGIVNAEFLNGHNVTNMTVTFEANASAGFNNTVGYYEIDPTGQLVNVTILAANAKTASGPMDITVSDPDNDIGFFLVQDGGRRIDQAEFGADDFEFVSDGAGGFDLASQGIVLTGINVFFSHDAALNPDGMQHVLSGVSDDGEGALRIGFEDLMRNGKSDDDFQDVVLYVDIA
ncbi:hypothetical protein AVJ23_07950 [Pseudoponticoccus marisrubri]|uniref:DUF4114 domain-containing protein n=1 Tax=Pseudoponticoccus marisrubri TaxID=1685382 RepID=A0A0W7WMB7_9RHOB|nr:hypothetical protein AVJ23_07950 [Pseudoponticoccus marisrubri]